MSSHYLQSSPIHSPFSMYILTDRKLLTTFYWHPGCVGITILLFTAYTLLMCMWYVIDLYRYILSVRSAKKLYFSCNHIYSYCTNEA